MGKSATSGFGTTGELVLSSTYAPLTEQSQTLSTLYIRPCQCKTRQCMCTVCIIETVGDCSSGAQISGSQTRAGGGWECLPRIVF